jgi:hypothetical protein
MSANGICEKVVFECQGVIRMRRGLVGNPVCNMLSLLEVDLAPLFVVVAIVLSSLSLLTRIGRPMILE